MSLVRSCDARKGERHLAVMIYQPFALSLRARTGKLILIKDKRCTCGDLISDSKNPSIQTHEVERDKNVIRREGERERGVNESIVDQLTQLKGLLFHFLCQFNWTHSYLEETITFQLRCALEITLLYNVL